MTDTIERADAPASAQVVTTATARRVVRRALFWVAAVTTALLITGISLLVLRTGAPTNALAADSPTPQGAQALVRVLERQGVTVTATSSLDETAEAITDRDGSTVLFSDENGYLDARGIERLGALATRLVVVQPGFQHLEALAPAVASAGFLPESAVGELDAGCDLPAARRAGTIQATSDDQGYRVIDETADAVACFAADSAFEVVRLATAERTTTVVGSTAVFQNGAITSAGGAALALGLLGETSKLVWYLPTAADLGDGPTLAELTPGWVTPLSVLALLTAVAAAFWRGRRLGPLVVENLPVTVRASETMEGRARLYDRSSSRLHALDALRIGTIDRIASTCGLPRAATVDEVVDAAASVTGRDRSRLREVLVSREPATDAELVRLSDALLELERLVSSAVARNGAARP